MDWEGPASIAINISSQLKMEVMAYWVDQMIRYMDALASTATDAYIQKQTCIVV